MRNRPPISLPDLDELLRRTRAGEEAAREALFRQLRHELRQRAESLAQRRPPRGEDYSDLADGAIERLLSHFERFAGTSSGELRKYTFRILENYINGLHRSAGRKKRDQGVTLSLNGMGSEPPAEGPRLSQVVARKEEGRLVLARLLTLPASQRQALWYHREGLPVAEIARLLGCTEKAVASRIERAVSALRQDLRGEDGAQGEGAPLRAAFLRYLHGLERGEVGDREGFLLRHAGEAPGLRALLEGLDWLDAQLREQERAAS